MNRCNKFQDSSSLIVLHQDLAAQLYNCLENFHVRRSSYNISISKLGAWPATRLRQFTTWEAYAYAYVHQTAVKSWARTDFLKDWLESRTRISCCRCFYLGNINKLFFITKLVFYIFRAILLLDRFLFLLQQYTTISLITTAATRCYAPYISYSALGCYYFVTRVVVYADAPAACAQVGGELYYPTSTHDYEDLRRHFLAEGECNVWQAISVMKSCVMVHARGRLNIYHLHVAVQEENRTANKWQILLKCYKNCYITSISVASHYVIMMKRSLKTLVTNKWMNLVAINI